MVILQTFPSGTSVRLQTTGKFYKVKRNKVGQYERKIVDSLGVQRGPEKPAFKEQKGSHVPMRSPDSLNPLSSQIPTLSSFYKSQDTTRV